MWLEYQGHYYQLGLGDTVIGRGAGCQLVLDDALVSRRHAQVTIEGEQAVIRDLRSVNGVLVNGERVEESRGLVAGDTIRIGKQELIFRAAPMSEAPSINPKGHRYSAETLHGAESLKSLGLEDDSTHQGDALKLLGSLADKVLALGRGVEAERILSGALHNVLGSCKQGKALTPEQYEGASTYAVKLAEATGKGVWVDYVFRLYTIQKVLIPASVVDQMYDRLRKVKGVDTALFRHYLSEVDASMGPAERFVFKRIQGLERLMNL